MLKIGKIWGKILSPQCSTKIGSADVSIAWLFLLGDFATDECKVLSLLLALFTRLFDQKKDPPACLVFTAQTRIALTD